MLSNSYHIMLKNYNTVICCVRNLICCVKLDDICFAMYLSNEMRGWGQPRIS